MSEAQSIENLRVDGTAGLTLTGNSGNNNIRGGAGNDTLIGGLGNDILTSYAGNDVFRFARGDGQDRVFASKSDGSDTLAFTSGIAHDQLWFGRSSDDLIVSVIGEGQTVTVSDWFASNNNHARQITTGDGYTITDTGAEQLVQAMASFAPPGAGQTSLPSNLATSLAPALAANWQHP